MLINMQIRGLFPKNELFPENELFRVIPQKWAIPGYSGLFRVIPQKP